MEWSERESRNYWVFRFQPLFITYEQNVYHKVRREGVKKPLDFHVKILPYIANLKKTEQTVQGLFKCLHCFQSFEQALVW